MTRGEQDKRHATLRPMGWRDWTFVAAVVCLTAALDLACAAVPATLAPAEPEPPVRKCMSPPAAPRVDWVAPGCPPQFGACLSPEDSAAMAEYLRASRRWMARCGDGR